MDIGEDGTVESWVAASAEEFGGIDIVVASVSALALEPTMDNWRTTVEVDLLSTVLLVEAAMPHLERSEVPSIVTVSSVSGHEADFTVGPYSTIETAIIGYTQGLAF